MAKKPYLKLRRLIEDEGLEHQELAKLVGMGTSTMSKRLNTEEEYPTWNCSEIIGICRVLHIPQEQIGELFFPNVEKGA